jgi:hypothetical protein
VTEDHAERLRTLEATVSEIRVRQTQMESLLEQQIVAAGQIKSDTEEIVALIKGANALARLMKWITAI